MLAPIALFIYNRPFHTTNCLESLLRNPESADSDLVVFADGPKDNATVEDLAELAAARQVVKDLKGFKSVRLQESAVNKGLAKSIIEGVTQLVAEFGKVIVIEDDLVLSANFLTYMNGNLDKYAQDERVISIHGYNYPIVTTGYPYQSFFLKGADCWGWATWKRGWDLFDADAMRLYNRIKEQKLAHEFDFWGSYPYTQLLKDNAEGKSKTWAIRWYASAFLANKLTLYPCQSFVRNEGTDGSGTNCQVSDIYDVALNHQSIIDENIPIEESILLKKRIAKQFPTLFDKISERIKSWLA